MKKTVELSIKGPLAVHPGRGMVFSDFKEGKKDMEFLVELDAEGLIKVSYPATEGSIGIVDHTVDAHSELKDLTDALGQIDHLKGKISEITSRVIKIEVTFDAEEIAMAFSGIATESLSDVQERLDQEGITSKDASTEIVNYLREQCIDDYLIKKVLERHKKYDDEFSRFISNKPATAFVDAKKGTKYLPRIISYILGGTAIRLSGDASTGKNLLLDTMSWVFATPLFQKPISGNVDKFDLLGSKTISSKIDEHGNTLNEVEFEEDMILKAMKIGAFINLDEVNLGAPEILELLNPILDYRRSIDVPGHTRVSAIDGFNAFATMNPSSYIGTRDLNEAFASRFITIQLEPTKSIIDLLRIHSRSQGVGSDILNVIERLYASLYQLAKIEEQLDPKALSFRLYAEAALYAANPYIGIKQALIDSVANIVDDTDQRNSVIDVIDSIC